MEGDLGGVPRLIRLAKRYDWAAVVEHAQSHPEDIDTCDTCFGYRGRTVFHYICEAPAPLSVLQLLVQIDSDNHAQNPEARSVLRSGCGGITPLMVACRNLWVSLVRELVKSVPELVSMTDDMDSTVAHYVMSVVEYDMIAALKITEIILQQDPSLRHENNDSGSTMTSMLLFGNSNFNDYVLSYPERDGCNVFRSLLHLCLYGQRDEPAKTTPLLHRFLQFRQFPVHEMRRALELRPELAHEKDEDGNTPLHVAASNLFPSAGILRILYLRDKLSLLMENNTSAVRERNHNGFLPLQIAIQASENRRWYGGIRRLLLDAHPTAIETFCFEDAMYPFVLATAKGNPSTLFQMLKAKPSLVRRAF